MNNDFRNTIAEQLAVGGQSNPAMRVLLEDYARYHAVFVIAGSAVVLACAALCAYFWVRFNSAPKPHSPGLGFERRAYLAFSASSLVVGLLFALLVAANATNTFDPSPGFSRLAAQSRTSSGSGFGLALNGWIRSGDASMPTALKERVQRRVAFQQPKAIACGALLAIFVALSVRLWNALFVAARGLEPRWTPKRRGLLVAGLFTLAASLVMVVMVVANAQGAIAPVAISALGAGG